MEVQRIHKGKRCVWGNICTFTYASTYPKLQEFNSVEILTLYLLQRLQ